MHFGPIQPVAPTNLRPLKIHRFIRAETEDPLEFNRPRRDDQHQPGNPALQRDHGKQRELQTVRRPLRSMHQEQLPSRSKDVQNSLRPRKSQSLAPNPRIVPDLLPRRDKSPLPGASATRTVNKKAAQQRLPPSPYLLNNHRPPVPSVPPRTFT